MTDTCEQLLKESTHMFGTVKFRQNAVRSKILRLLEELKLAELPTEMELVRASFIADNVGATDQQVRRELKRLVLGDWVFWAWERQKNGRSGYCKRYSITSRGSAVVKDLDRKVRKTG